MSARRRQHGFTLAELIVSIVVLGIAVTGVLAVYVMTIRQSVDPQRLQQAVAVAEGYLDEILSRPVDDPGGPAESGRADFDDIQDYDGLSDNPPEDQTGSALPLNGYTVTVQILDSGDGVSLGPGGDPVDPGDIYRVDVTVSYDAGGIVTLSGYRARR